MVGINLWSFIKKLFFKFLSFYLKYYGIARQRQFSKRHYLKRISKLLKVSSSIFALIGGILLASKTNNSEFGFLFLGFSSSQLLLASITVWDEMMILYSASVFLFVDCNKINLEIFQEMTVAEIRTLFGISVDELTAI